jgi:signal transduction histidine kinase
VLRVEVEDDGPGLGDEFDLDAPVRGVGLRNLRERIDVFFGHAGRLSIGSGPMGGTLATIEIPYRADHRQLAPAADRQMVAG